MGWSAFQQLCHSILREVLGQTVQAFLDNNDAGRDGAFVGRWAAAGGVTYEGNFVLQCKHTSRGEHNLVLSDLSDELPKVEKLVREGRCDIYVLLTNAGVSGSAEESIGDALRAVGVKHSLVLGRTWLEQQISENSRLRRLVPGLYGLGDLTQILDARAYQQASAVLDAMRTDLAKLVLTSAYEAAATALARHGFVLLLGAPATGKTTLAAQLALGAVDDFDAAVVKLDTIAELKDRWNPNERQLFWLDDAFGPTQFDRTLARDWVLAISRVDAAIASKSMFVLTSRDYVFKAARPHLKASAFPLLDESQVVIDVSALRVGERQQILYNHLRHGAQPNAFLLALTSHLEAAAKHPGFTPELARRLADPFFTRRLAPRSSDGVDDFFSHPSEFLRDVMVDLDEHARAALGLIFINRNWLPSPIKPSPREQDLLDRLGSSLGQVTQALESLKGSMVQLVTKDGEHGWVFSHPTMVDAYSRLLESSELLHHLVAGSPLEGLLVEITCGDVNLEGAIVVPPELYAEVLSRLHEAADHDQSLRRLRTTFLSSRCDRAFLAMWLDEDPTRMARFTEPGLMLEAVPENDLAGRLNEFGLLPETIRARFAGRLIDLCITGEDPAVLWEASLRSILTDDEDKKLRERIRTEQLTQPRELLRTATEWWDGSDEDAPPESAVEQLRTLVYSLPREFPEDDFVASAAKRLDQLLDEWVGEQAWRYDDDDDRPYPERQVTSAPVSSDANRSVFDDLAQDRS